MKSEQDIRKRIKHLQDIANSIRDKYIQLPILSVINNLEWVLDD